MSGQEKMDNCRYKNSQDCSNILKSDSCDFCAQMPIRILSVKRKLFVKVLITIMLIIDVGFTPPFSYTVVRKENISKRLILLVFNIQNNEAKEISHGTVYDISVNNFEYKFRVEKPITRNEVSKGFALIFGSLSEKEFNNLYYSDKDEINFRIELDRNVK